MKPDKSALITNAVFFGLAFLMLISTGFYGSSIGLLMLVIAFLNLILILIYSASGNRNGMFTSLIFMGVLFTIGASVCSGHGWH